MTRYKNFISSQGNVNSNYNEHMILYQLMGEKLRNLTIIGITHWQEDKFKQSF